METKAPFAVAVILLLVSLSSALAAEVTSDRLLNAGKDPNNWMMYGKDYRGWRFSDLKQINTENVHRLVPKWAFQTGITSRWGFQNNPIAVDGRMYITTPMNTLFCVDAKNGKLLWRYDYKNREDAAFLIDANRGVAVGYGRVFMGTIDSHVIALDAETGKLAWDVEVGDRLIGQAITAAPLLVKDKVVVGGGMSEYGANGFVAAYDPKTGKKLWWFNTIPGPGEPGHATWPGESWKTGGGGIWVTPVYDVELNLLYVGVANPAPDFVIEGRQGENLYTNSVIALDADTGKLQWYFQHVPQDVWDFDSAQQQILVDVEIGGRMLKGIAQPHKNGFFYLVDRTNGRFIYAKPFVERMNWATGVDLRTGRPIVNPESFPTKEGTVVCPGVHGGTNWTPIAYNPKMGLAYLPVAESCNTILKTEAPYERGRLYMGGRYVKTAERAYGHIDGVDVRTGETRWRAYTKYPVWSGLVTTGGDLVFYGDLEGDFVALDARTGEELWRFNTGSGIYASPITYAVQGKQYVAVPSGARPRIAGDGAPELKSAPTGSGVFVFGLFED